MISMPDMQFECKHMDVMLWCHIMAVTLFQLFQLNRPKHIHVPVTECSLLLLRGKK